MKPALRLLLVAAVLRVGLAAVFRSSMVRKETLQAKLLQEGRAHEFRAAHRAATAQTPFFDYGNAEYNLQVGVGTPPQLFEVVPDTGTSEAWLVDSTCDPNNSYNDCPIYCKEPMVCAQVCEAYCCGPPATPTPPARLFDHGDPCANKRQFDQTASGTYTATSKTFNGSSELGFVSGFLGQDTYSFGDVAIAGVTFGQADRLSVSFTNAPMDGLLGLGFADADFDGKPSVVQQAIDSGLLDAPLFTIWLESAGGQPFDQPAGAFTLGDVDAEHCSTDWTAASLASDSIYLLQTTAYGTNGARESGDYTASLPTLVSLGAGQLIVPLAVYVEVTETTDAQFDWDYGTRSACFLLTLPSSGLYAVDCSIQFTWSVWVNDDTKLTVDQSTLLLPTPDGRCFLNFVYLEDSLGGVNLVLGTPFLRQYCTLYLPVGRQIAFSRPL
ncbi:putative aspartic protease [Aphelenchoides fujianensis]|nr:putative aspartic protease [Aphelenchoides fujianensis]